MAPFAIASTSSRAVPAPDIDRNRIVDMLLRGRALSDAASLSAPIFIPAKHVPLPCVVRRVRGGGAAPHDYEYLADNNSVSGDKSDDSPSGTVSVPTPKLPSDEANSIIRSFEEELVRIRRQIEVEAEQEWDSWRRAMLERRRMRRKRLQNEQQEREKKEEEEKQVEVEAAKEEHEVHAEPDTSADMDTDEVDDESAVTVIVDEREESVSESELILLDDEEEGGKEEEEDRFTSTSSEETVDVVNEVDPLEDNDDEDENLEDNINQHQDEIELVEEDDTEHDDKTAMHDGSEEGIGVQFVECDGNIHDVNAPINTQEDIGFIGDYDAPTDYDDELSGDEEDAFKYEHERQLASVDAKGKDTANVKMDVKSKFASDSNSQMEGQVINKSDAGSVAECPEKRRSKGKKKKKKKRKKKPSQHAVTIEASLEGSDTEHSQVDVAFAPTTKGTGTLLSPSFARKVVFYVGFTAFLFLFKMVLDALMRMGLQ